MAEKSKRNLDSTRNLLLQAAEKLMMNCNEPSEVTSRVIAKESGVNLAMINYCFGSREGLLYEVFKKNLSDVQKNDAGFMKIMLSDISPKEKLAELHFKMMRLMISNFKISQAVTKFILFNRNEDFGMESLPFIAEHFKGKKSMDECKLIALELTSLHELAVLRHETLKSSCDIDLTEDNTLKQYICQNVDRFLD
ncbi:MAG: TetR/AcrR family transcriptional regulator [Ruminococcus sp.]|nr:TetR/AcrR family transcriptional regulator [Ruminococcus sp.]